MGSSRIRKPKINIEFYSDCGPHRVGIHFEIDLVVVHVFLKFLDLHNNGL